MISLPVFTLLFLLFTALPVSASDGAGAALPIHRGPWGSGWEPADVAIGDLNGDGNADLVVVYGSHGKVDIALGDGTGSFRRDAEIPMDTGLSGVAIGTIGRDRTPFLAILNGRTRKVSFRLRTADGLYERPWPDLPVGEDPREIVVGYRDKKGEKPFVAVINNGSNDLSLFESNGKGPFEPFTVDLKRKGRPNPSPAGLAVGDLDNDGRPDDMMITNHQYYSATTLIGKKKGVNERKQRDLRVPAGPVGVGFAPIGADDRPILAVANSAHSSVTLYLRDEERRQGWARIDSLQPGASPTCLAVGPIGEFRLPILAVADRHTGRITVWLIDWEGKAEKIKCFRTEDGDIRAVAVGCLKGTDRPFVVAAGRRLHAFPLFWEPEKQEWPDTSFSPILR